MDHVDHSAFEVDIVDGQPERLALTQTTTGSDINKRPVLIRKAIRIALAFSTGQA